MRFKSLGMCAIFFLFSTIGVLTMFLGVGVDNALVEASSNTNSTKEARQIKKETHLFKVISELQPRLDPKITNIYVESIKKYSNEYDIPKGLICAIISRESSFNPIAVSSANCIGPMQINPKAHSELMKNLGITYHTASHIDNNTMLGCKIFKEYYASEGTVKGALKRYFGANNKEYINDIFEIYVNISMKNSTEES